MNKEGRLGSVRATEERVQQCKRPSLQHARCTKSHTTNDYSSSSQLQAQVCKRNAFKTRQTPLMHTYTNTLNMLSIWPYTFVCVTIASDLFTCLRPFFLHHFFDFLSIIIRFSIFLRSKESPLHSRDFFFTVVGNYSFLIFSILGFRTCNSSMIYKELCDF